MVLMLVCRNWFYLLRQNLPLITILSRRRRSRSNVVYWAAFAQSWSVSQDYLLTRQAIVYNFIPLRTKESVVGMILLKVARLTISIVFIDFLRSLLHLIGKIIAMARVWVFINVHLVYAWIHLTVVVLLAHHIHRIHVLVTDMGVPLRQSSLWTLRQSFLRSINHSLKYLIFLIDGFFLFDEHFV